MKGLIYCFNTVGDSNIFKAGHTTTTLQKRLGGYLGPSKPRTIVFCRNVANSAFAERLMLDLMRQCVSIAPRNDLGDEWFVASGNYTFEERQKHLEYIAKVAQMATRGRKFKPESLVRPVSVEQGELTLRGLELYFAKFDEFVKEAPFDAFDSVETLIASFEGSKLCPFGKLCAFMPYDEGRRRQVVKNRYKKLLS
jgi:hypothetical protein